MNNMNIPIEVYDILERKLGRDDAMTVAKSIEKSLSHINDRSREIAHQRKIEIKEELRVELRDELTTKADLAKMEGSLRSEIAKLDKKFTVYFISTIFAVVFVNQNALEFLARLFGLIK